MNPLKLHTGTTIIKTLNTPGIYLEHTWNAYESTQIPPRFHLRSTWKTSGKHLEHTWNPLKFHPDSTLDQLENIWKTPGTYLESIWIHSNSTQVPPWTNSSASLEYTWNLHGTSMDYLDSTWSLTLYVEWTGIPWNFLRICRTNVDSMWTGGGV